MSLFNRNSQPASQTSNQDIPDYFSDRDLEKYVLCLYVASNSLRSIKAIQRVQKLCEERLPGRYELEIVDIYKDPERLERDQVFAVPTLIRQLPPPLRRLIGDMTDTEKLIVCLDL
jgi:circadian clock protein KaiB